jgi:AraC-like DNA-binding protein
MRDRLRLAAMDQLAGFLDGPRARGAFLLRSVLDPPFSLRIQDEAPLTVVAMVRGTAWIAHDDRDDDHDRDDDPDGRGDPAPRRLGPGDTAIVRGPDPYTVADDPATAPQVVIHPGQRCTTPDGVTLSGTMDLGVRTWGTNPAGSVAMLTGTYTTDGEVSRWLLEALPRLAVVPAAAWDSPIPALLAAEIGRDAPGQEVVLDRLLDLLLVAALRAIFARADAGVPSWYRAHDDPVVGRALRLLHGAPAHPWTVAELAAGAGVSRALFARRFHERVGEPPMAFLTSWRMALAADLLREDGATVGSVARRVGYGSPFTFSTAFKRAHGMSPTAYRTRQPAGAGAAAAG